MTYNSSQYDYDDPMHHEVESNYHNFNNNSNKKYSRSRSPTKSKLRKDDFDRNKEYVNKYKTESSFETLSKNDNFDDNLKHKKRKHSSSKKRKHSSSRKRKHSSSKKRKHSSSRKKKHSSSRNRKRSSSKEEKHKSTSSKRKRTRSPKMSDEELMEYLRGRRQEVTSIYENENQNNKIEIIDPHLSVSTDAECSPNGNVDRDSPHIVEPEIYNDMFSDAFEITADSALVKNQQHDENDDTEGYYKIRLGEILDNRYLVYNFSGMGVFSSVFRVRDVLNNDQEMAIKVIRNNDMMHRSGLQEIKFLERINEGDKNKNHHCINFIRYFYHKNHLCMVFELLDMNLRNLVEKFGRNVGLNINAVRVYARQLLQALKLLKKVDIIHGDIKPDNILINAKRTSVKLSDFGSACHSADSNITEYFVSRFYRAPEIMLGLKYDYNIDTWAVGATLYELYTGKVMFPGKSNNEMLKLIMDAKGKIPHKMIKNAVFRDKHFDSQFNFLYMKVDAIFHTEGIKILTPSQSRPFAADLFDLTGLSFEEENSVKQFRDILDKMMQLNPDNRISVDDALRHPFFTESKKLDLNIFK